MSRKKVLLISLILFPILIWLFLRIWSSAGRDLQYRLVDLGLPNSSAFAINNWGVVLGNQEVGNTSRSFVWSETAGVIHPGTGIKLWAINDLGYAVGHIQNSTDDPGKGVIWNNTFGFNAAQEIGFNEALPGLWLRDINNKNQIVGSLRNLKDRKLDDWPPKELLSVSHGDNWPPKEHRAFVWDVTRGLNIVEANGGYTFKADAINESGFIIGRASSEERFISFVRMENETLIPMDRASPGVNQILFSDINSGGDLVGVVTTATGEEKACHWRDGKISYLSNLGGTYSAAFGINEEGVTVGHSYTWLDDFLRPRTFWRDDWEARFFNRFSKWRPGWYIPSAVIWIDGQIQDLNEITEKSSDWFLESAKAINNQGQIVGGGYVGEEHRAFLLNPIE